jgi:hypothetical protein
MRVVPAFNTLDGVWYVEDPRGIRAKARSLAKL